MPVKKRFPLMALVPVIMAAMFILPFTVFRNVNAWYGSFAFWLIATIAVIGINAIATRGWK